MSKPISITTSTSKNNMLEDLFGDEICGSLSETINYWAKFGFMDKKHADFLIVPKILEIIKKYTKLTVKRDRYDEDGNYIEPTDEE